MKRSRRAVILVSLAAALAATGIGRAKLDGGATVGRLKAIPTDDDCFVTGPACEGGRKIHPSCLWEVGTRAERKGPWGDSKAVAATPAGKAFHPPGRAAVHS